MRMLLLGVAVLMLAGAPFYTSVLGTVLPLLVVGSILLVALAALTSPSNPFVMRLNAVAAGVGAIVFEYWALASYQKTFPIEFALKQIIALLCMFAFYYSLKTLRAMINGLVPSQSGPMSEAQIMEADGFEKSTDVLEDNA